MEIPKDGKKRRAFCDIPDIENDLASREGFRIYQELKAKYGAHDDTACDIILNSLCAGLLYLLNDRVHTDNRPYIVQLIHKILTQNLNRNK